jgi:hypothetical protein
MTVVNTKEFNSNQDKYLDLALKEQVVLQRDDNLFVIQNYALNSQPDVIFEPDEDFYNSISMDEFRKTAIEDLREIFRNGKR